MNHKEKQSATQFSRRSEEKIATKFSSLLPFFTSFENPLKYGITFVIASLIVGFIWYISLSSAPIPDQALVTIKAPTGAFKIKPTEETNDDAKQHSKTIYEKLEAKSPDEKIEHLLKEPEEPMPLPPSLPDDFIGNLLNEEEIPDVLSGSDQKEANKPLEEISKETEESKFLKELDDHSNEMKDINQKNQHSLPIPNEESNIKPFSKDSISSITSSDKGEMFWIQLASLRSKEAAEREWKRVATSAKTKALLGTLKPSFSSSGEGDALCYRIRIGPFPVSQAKDLVQKLKALKIECLLRKIS